MRAQRLRRGRSVRPKRLRPLLVRGALRDTVVTDTKVSSPFGLRDRLRDRRGSGGSGATAASDRPRADGGVSRFGPRSPIFGHGAAKESHLPSVGLPSLLVLKTSDLGP
jgi:hypothetical protein